jgi:hypothetical protein
MKSASPEHWSKDFVEHLRTVHFALVTVSVVLILILTSREYNAKTARSELNAIIEMEKVLMPDSGRKPEITHRSKDPHLFYRHHSTNGDATWFAAEPSSKVLDPAWKLPSRLTFIFHVPHDYMFSCDVDRRQYVHISALPNSVREFQRWWDSIAVAPLRVVNINDIESPGDLDSSSNSFTSKLADLSATSVVDDPKKAIELSVDWRTSCGNPHIKEWRATFLTGSDGPYSFRFEVIPMSSEIKSDDLVSFFRENKKGVFKDAFSDLAIAARGRDTENFDTLATELREEASQTGEAFEAFGIKFPSGQVTRWGMIVLIVVQFYFIMYLARLSNKLRPDDPGWDIPWMAMDNSLLARVMLAVSIIALPCVAAILVLLRAESPWFADGYTWHIVAILKSLGWRSRVEFVLMPIAVLTSFVLSGLAWHYRPQLTEPVAPAQLFE